MTTTTIEARGKQKRRSRVKPSSLPLGKRTKTPALGEPAGKLPPVGQIRQLIGFSQPEFGRLTSYSTRAVADWESGKQMDNRARRRVTEIQRLLAALSELMPANALGPWLRDRNDAFDGHSPLQLIEHGELDRIWQMIHQIDANVAN